MMTSSITFVLIPGAWHPASALDLVANPLEAAGYTVRSVDLPSCGAEPPLDDFGPDVRKLSRIIAEEADRGQDVVLFMRKQLLDTIFDPSRINMLHLYLAYRTKTLRAVYFDIGHNYFVTCFLSNSNEAASWAL